MPDPHPDMNWPPEPQPEQDQSAQERSGRSRSAREQSAREQSAREQSAREQSAREQSARVQSARERSSRAQAWLAELTAGVRKIRELEAGPVEAGAAVPEALAAGFTHRVRDAVGSGFAGGGRFDRLAPGPDLADFTADAWARELAGLSDDELVGVLCAWRRLGSWAMAGELAAVTELARRRPGAVAEPGRASR